MKARIEASYERKQNRSLKTVGYCFKHLETGFQFRRVIDITTPAVQEYTTKRLQEGAARASVNRALVYLRHGFKLMLKPGTFRQFPQSLNCCKARMYKGFVAPAEFQALLENIPDTDSRDLVAFLYNTGSAQQRR